MATRQFEYKITTPVEGYTGVIYGVPISSGVGHTDDPWLVQRFKEGGYTVEPTGGNEQDNVEDVKPDANSTKAEINAYLDAHGIEHDPKAKNEELLALIEG